MVLASQLRPGVAIRYDGQPYKVTSADYHPGQGKMGGVTHVRLRNLETSTSWETSFRADLRLEELPLEKKSMDFLFSESDLCTFMDPDTCEQAEVPSALLGDQARFLEPEMRVIVEFLADKPVSVQLPGFLEVRIDDTAPPAHIANDNTWKPARLPNGLEIMVPQFIKTGDSIRLDLSTLKYMDRVKSTRA